MGTVPANFHGVKGKSGRKSIAVEFNKFKTIEKAWKKIDEGIDNAESINKQTDIALPIVLKDMASKVSNADGSNLELQQVLVKFISDDTDRT